MKTRIGLSAFFLVGCLTIMGCSGGKKIYPVEGFVKVDGQPIEGATVYFIDDTGVSATGMTSASGKFKLISSGQEGVPAGKYKVYVTKAENKAASAAEKYKDDPTKAYQEYMKASGAKIGSKGSIEIEKPKSEIPERYTKPGALPDVIVPTSSPVEIEMKKK